MLALIAAFTDIMATSNRSIITEEDDEIYCFCNQQEGGFLIQCDECDRWNHGHCLNVTEAAAYYIDKFYCDSCRLANTSLEITRKRQCLSPACLRPARKNSNYCHKECGLRLVLPMTRSLGKYEIRRPDNNVRFLKALRKKSELQDARIVQLILLVDRSKNSPGDTVLPVVHSEAERPVVNCKLCDDEVSVHDYYVHLGNCFMRRTILLPDGKSTKRDNVEWNVFCNQEIDDVRLCKNLRVLCIDHYISPRNDHVICGFPLEMNLGASIGTFCGSPKIECLLHPYYWEELKRAEFDLDKLHILLNILELERDGGNIRKAKRKHSEAISESEAEE